MYKFTTRLVLIIIILLTLSCQRVQDKNNEVFETRIMLGAPLIIRLYEGGDKKLLDTIFDEIEIIERTMSTSTKDYQTTEIIEINKHSSLTKKNETFKSTISLSVAEVLESSLEIARLTQGSFDPTIQPIIALWGWGSDSTRIPNHHEILNTLSKVDWKKISINPIEDNPNRKMLMMEGQQGIDVGGIAKGYAADIAQQKLVENGVTSAIIDFGGNIVAVGNKKDGSLWKIGIQKPYENVGEMIAIVETEETSVVTSGIYERFFEENGKKYSHLINPTSGYPVDNRLQSVTILCKESIVADGLSTGIFVLGLEDGLKLVNQLNEVEAIFITQNQKVYISNRLENKVTIVNEDYKLEKIHFTK